MSLIVLALALGVAAVGAVALLGRRGVERTPEEVAEIIERFVAGTASDWEWDDFISVRIRNPQLETIARRCAGLPQEFPPTIGGSYTSADGLAVLQAYVRTLRRRNAPPVDQKPAGS